MATAGKHIRTLAYRKLGWCPECKESSTVVKFYGENKKSRIEVCLNHGCDYLRHLPRLADDKPEAIYEEDIDRNVSDMHPAHPDCE
jgi:hypothetical protein